MHATSSLTEASHKWSVLVALVELTISGGFSLYPFVSKRHFECSDGTSWHTVWKGFSWRQWRVDRNINLMSSSTASVSVTFSFFLMISMCGQEDVFQSHGSVCNYSLNLNPLIICSWKNTNKEILVIAPGSIVKINICFPLVSIYLLFSETCYCSLFSCKVQTCLWHCSSWQEECSHAQLHVGISAQKQKLLT